MTQAKKPTGQSESEPAGQKAEHKQSLEDALVELIKTVEEGAAPMFDDLVRNDSFLSLSGNFWNGFFGVRSGIRSLQEKASELLNQPTKTGQDLILYKLNTIQAQLNRLERKVDSLTGT